VATTKAEAMRLGRLLSPDMSAQFGTAQAVEAAPFQVMAMVGEPDAILAMPAPDARLPYALAMRHFARATAFAQMRDKAGFDGEMKAMAAQADHPGTRDLVWPSPCRCPISYALPKMWRAGAGRC
ncbi:MAG: hypothetical protein MUE77_09825, partial [Sandarakinorhabdus sp.]|nr:hypothetical protein [Sandarakinorhabdus sp.]